ncbi:MAG TPA: hypothetical protein VFM05_09975, partial [Candidatus Saccharimonadales bacterium]|nr:hypothetical protein [Candidatus Saccharimonadales bacterium]
LGALVLGALSAECREERDNGETFRVETNRDSATLHFSRIVKIAGCAAISRPCGTVYTVSATAKSNVAGELEPTQVVSFVVVHEDYFVDAKGGTQYGLEATDIGTGWLVDATQSTEDGTLYTFTANTGGSLADIQTHEIVEDTKEVLARAFA